MATTTTNLPKTYNAANAKKLFDKIKVKALDNSYSPEEENYYHEYMAALGAGTVGTSADLKRLYQYINSINGKKSFLQTRTGATLSLAFLPAAMTFSVGSQLGVAAYRAVTHKSKEDCLKHTKGATGGLHIPVYYNGLSFINNIAYSRTWKSNYKYLDFTKVRFDEMPIDADRNIDTVHTAVDRLFQATDLHTKIISLDQKIKASVRTVGSSKTVDDGKRDVAALIQTFSSDAANVRALKGFHTDLQEIRKAVVNGFLPIKDKNGKDIGSQFQGINSGQKSALLSYLDDMDEIVSDLQKPDFGVNGAHLSEAKNKRDLELFLNRLNSIAKITEMRLEDEGQKHKKHAIEPRDSVVRLIERGYYSKARNNTQDQIPSPIDKGRAQALGLSAPNADDNSEALLDVYAIDVHNQMAGRRPNAPWDKTDDETLARTIFELVENNMLSEALYVIREIRWRLERNDAKHYKMGYLDILRKDLKDTGNPYYEVAFFCINQEGAGRNKKGGPGTGPPPWWQKLVHVPFNEQAPGSGVRWAREQWLLNTWFWRIRTRHAGNSPVSTPGRGMQTEKINDKRREATEYMKCKVKYYTKDAEGNKVEQHGWYAPKNYKYENVTGPDGKVTGKKKVKFKPSDPEFISLPKTLFGFLGDNRIVGANNPLNRLWHSKFAMPARAAVRWPQIATPYVLGWKYGRNLLITGAGLFGYWAGALHLAEEAYESVTGTELKLDVGSRMLGGAANVASWAAAPGAYAFDYTLGALGKAGLDKIPGINMNEDGYGGQLQYDWVKSVDGFVPDFIMDKDGNFGTDKNAWGLISNARDVFHDFNQSVIGDRGNSERFLSKTVNATVDAVGFTVELAGNLMADDEGGTASNTLTPSETPPTATAGATPDTAASATAAAGTAPTAPTTPAAAGGGAAPEADTTSRAERLGRALGKVNEAIDENRQKTVGSPWGDGVSDIYGGTKEGLGRFADNANLPYAYHATKDRAGRAFDVAKGVFGDAKKEAEGGGSSLPLGAASLFAAAVGALVTHKAVKLITFTNKDKGRDGFIRKTMRRSAALFAAVGVFGQMNGWFDGVWDAVKSGASSSSQTSVEQIEKFGVAQQSYASQGGGTHAPKILNMAPVNSQDHSGGSLSLFKSSYDGGIVFSMQGKDSHLAIKSIESPFNVTVASNDGKVQMIKHGNEKRSKASSLDLDSLA